MWVETGGMWNQEDRNVKIRRRLTISVFRNSVESVCVLGSLYFGLKGTWETCWEEGAKSTGEEGDIIGDFPPGLHHLQHTHLVFLRFSHKAGFVCAETVQEVRSDMGQTWRRGWQLTKDTVADVVFSRQLGQNGFIVRKCSLPQSFTGPALGDGAAKSFPFCRQRRQCHTSATNSGLIPISY